MLHARDDYNRIQDPLGKIPADEPVILLRGQDELACKAVEYYAFLCSKAQAPDVAAKACEHAERMRLWPVKKVPDLPQDATPVQQVSSPTGFRAVQDVLVERARQVSAEGYTPAHDDEHGDGSLADAAACYAYQAHYSGGSQAGKPPVSWPWDTESWKPGDARSMLVKAGALILAEIERLDRLAAAQPQHAGADGDSVR